MASNEMEIRGVKFEDWAAAITHTSQGMSVEQICEILDLKMVDWIEINMEWNEKLPGLLQDMELLTKYGEIYANPKVGKFANVEHTAVVPTYNYEESVQQYYNTGETAVDLNNPGLQNLIQKFNEGDFEEVTKLFSQFNESYRSFGFTVLGKNDNLKMIEEWISKDTNSSLPQIIKASHLMSKAWEARGTGTRSTVSDSDMEKMKAYLHEAKDMLLIEKDKESEYKIDCHALLLRLFRAINVDRSLIHQVFNEAQEINPNHAELNIAYFVSISYKWGGTEEEVHAYFQSLEHRTEFINNLIVSQYHFDLVRMYQEEDEDGKIKGFLEHTKETPIDSEELHRSTFYQLMFWNAGNLGYRDDEDNYLELLKPYLIQ